MSGTKGNLGLVLVDPVSDSYGTYFRNGEPYGYGYGCSIYSGGSTPFTACGGSYGFGYGNGSSAQLTFLASGNDKGCGTGSNPGDDCGRGNNYRPGYGAYGDDGDGDGDIDGFGFGEGDGCGEGDGEDGS